MNIFPKQIEPTAKDRDRLTNMGILGGWNKLVEALKEHDPNEEDTKKAILIELESKEPRGQIIQKLLVHLQKKERQATLANIQKQHPNFFVY